MNEIIIFRFLDFRWYVLLQFFYTSTKCLMKIVSSNVVTKYSYHKKNPFNKPLEIIQSTYTTPLQLFANNSLCDV